MNYKHYVEYWLFPKKESLITEEYKSIYDIQSKKIENSLIIFDIDDTLGENEGDISTKTIDFIIKLQNKGNQIALISNCTMEREKYLKKIFANLEVAIITKSDKPSPMGFNKILKEKPIKMEKTYMVGDRVATDLFGAYLAGIKNRFLVKPYSETFGGKKPGFVYYTFRAIENWFARNTL